MCAHVEINFKMSIVYTILMIIINSHGEKLERSEKEGDHLTLRCPQDQMEQGTIQVNLKAEARSWEN